MAVELCFMCEERPAAPFSRFCAICQARMRRRIRWDAAAAAFIFVGIPLIVYYFK